MRHFLLQLLLCIGILPTAGAQSYSSFSAIRMRYGLDFEDCDISTLKEDIEPIEFTKEKSL